MSGDGGSRYRFGPRERGGALAGWRAGQIVTVAVGLVFGVLVLRWEPDALGVAAAIGVLVLYGALATVRYQMMLEGVQECEARIVIDQPKRRIRVVARHDVEIVERPVEAIELRPLEVAINGSVVLAMAQQEITGREKRRGVAWRHDDLRFNLRTRSWRPNYRAPSRII